jgi:hypothetical protein
MSIETDNMEMENNDLKGLNTTLKENITVKEEIIKEQEKEITLLVNTLDRVYDMLHKAKMLIGAGLKR